ncbi:hypothetical protein [Ferroplasma sp.]|uniref:hypothetical protein n=1 Tax=Ferroplasma sp. TaxID=2591003 RepID=UPI00307CD49F
MKKYGGNMYLKIENNNIIYFSGLYFAPWSSSHGNAIQSMINALYGTGFGFLIDIVASAVNAAVGHQVLSGEHAVAFLGAFLVGLYAGYSSIVALSDAAAETGIAITATGALAAALSGIVAGYLGAISAE